MGASATLVASSLPPTSRPLSSHDPLNPLHHPSLIPEHFRLGLHNLQSGLGVAGPPSFASTVESLPSTPVVPSLTSLTSTAMSVATSVAEASIYSQRLRHLAGAGGTATAATATATAATTADSLHKDGGHQPSSSPKLGGRKCGSGDAESTPSGHKP